MATWGAFICEAPEHLGENPTTGVRLVERIEYRTPTGSKRDHTVNVITICKACADRRAEAWRQVRPTMRGRILMPVPPFIDTTARRQETLL